jgi:hypothetical protein
MSDTPWTPGPWRVVDERDTEELTGWGPAIAAGDGDPEPEGPNRYVAEVIADNGPEPDANARLIAVAPEMASCLRWLVDAPSPDCLSPIVEQARELLNRIRDEQ